jgi:hypothetical protein
MPLTTPPRKLDPLLAIARVVLVVMQGLTAFGALACMLAVPAIFIFRSQVEAELVSEGVPLEAFTALALLIAMAGVAVTLIFWVARLLWQMVDTVRDGDPFVPENATRLSRMAWIMLTIQIIGFPISAAAIWLNNITEDGHAENVGDGFSFSAILLVLILFILARVFRKGTEMREELEGTV